MVDQMIDEVVGELVDDPRAYFPSCRNFRICRIYRNSNSNLNSNSNWAHTIWLRPLYSNLGLAHLSWTELSTRTLL